MNDLVVHRNSYASIADADALLSSSIRSATKWSQAADSTKQAALMTFFRLLERQRWEGERAGVKVVASWTIAAAGSGYEIGDVVTVQGGTGDAAIFEVVNVGPSNDVTELKVVDCGSYSTFPTSPVATTCSNALGVDLQLDLVESEQEASWPRSGADDQYGNAVSSDEVPAEIIEANIQGAYELVNDPELEAAVTADSNIKSFHAGSVGVEYFGPQAQVGRFPITVQELIRPFLAGSSNTSGVSGGIATGTDTESTFDTDEEQFGLEGGIG